MLIKDFFKIHKIDFIWVGIIYFFGWLIIGATRKVLTESFFLGSFFIGIAFIFILGFSVWIFMGGYKD